jgi:hypothetical protein
MKLANDDFEYPVETKRMATNWTLPDRTRKTQEVRGRVSNRTDDIDGASPTRGSTKLLHKPDLFNVADIGGATCTTLIKPNVQKVNDRHINNRDIEHSYPESKLFSTPRVVDPLNPVYPLPSVKHRLPTPPKQKRDPLKTCDIPGTKAVRKQERTLVRNPLDYSDVPLSTAGSLTLARKRCTTGLSLETKDINSPASLEFHQSTRQTNPLEPQYRIFVPPGAEKTTWSIGEVNGSHPRKLKESRTDRPLLSLRSDDIDGAKATNHIPYPKERREWKKTCDISDIDTKGTKKSF